MTDKQPDSLVSEGAWDAFKGDLEERTKVQISGGQMVEMGEQGIAFDLSAGAAGWHPFKASGGSSSVTLEAGLIFFAGRVTHFNRTTISVPGGDWAVWARFKVEFSAAPSGNPVTDPWHIMPVVTDPPVIESGRFEDAAGTDGLVRYSAPGSEALYTWPGDFKWMICSRQGGTISQHVRTHLLFSYLPNGHLSQYGAFPSL